MGKEALSASETYTYPLINIIATTYSRKSLLLFWLDAVHLWDLVEDPLSVQISLHDNSVASGRWKDFAGLYQYEKINLKFLTVYIKWTEKQWRWCHPGNHVPKQVFTMFPVCSV